MRVRVIPFGVSKDWIGAEAVTVELPEGASVADLLERLTAFVAGQPQALRGIALSVNAEYARPDQMLHDGDEVGLLPPVSGGSPARTGAARTAGARDEIDPVIALTRERIDAETLVAAAKRGADGAVVVFDGIVRDNTRGRRTLYLDYEAYEEMALKQMKGLADEARERFGVREVRLAHRLGRLDVGETSVLIVVASAHRAAAFEACRWIIDTLKKTVPIWKKETFEDGAVWADGEPFPDGLALGPEGSHEG
ncbi:MAG TPA: molybdenum cofactor biosynthesis protein MoaE [Terracidiphilus sp.]|nr:molybdenum cofactor biosynthesis protein MoaE [Terracidiphilus sp.]